MTFVYLPSFDLSRGSYGNVEVVTAASPTQLVIDLDAFTWPNPRLVNTSVFNHYLKSYGDVVTDPFGGMDWERSELDMLPAQTFGSAITNQLRFDASDAGWPDPNSITWQYDLFGTGYYSLSYSEGITVVSWQTAAGRRLFGYSSDFSGSSTQVDGNQTPYYVLPATLNGPSSISLATMDDPVSTMAYSGGGRAYAISRTAAPWRQSWVQQYEPKTKVFRRSAPAAPNEYTYQDLFEDCRTGLPFAAGDIAAGGNVGAFTGYAFEPGRECFRPMAATPGNANQFHISFQAYALGTDLPYHRGSR